MGRGRPTFSQIRQNMIEILYFLGKAYGYEIYKAYKEIYPSVTLRVMYYHLKKGLSLEEFKQHKIVVEAGDYSWGGSVERIYYSLGKNADPKIDPKAKEFFDKKKQK
ncbi:MAG: hypothetical protein KKF44_01040 [Nanoarchaeota archaeon]|nr:hypothetical protein [Nanoarchaeota archaeon]